MGLPALKQHENYGIVEKPRGGKLKMIKSTKTRLKDNLNLPDGLEIQLQKNNEGEIIGINLSNDNLEYNIDMYSMPYCMDKNTGNGFGISNDELQNLFDLAKTQVDAEGKIFIMRNRKTILQNNTNPKDVFLKDKLFGYVVNFDGVLFRIETKGTGDYSLICVNKNDICDTDISQGTKKKVLKTIKDGLNSLSAQGRDYFLQNEEMIHTSLLN